MSLRIVATDEKFVVYGDGGLIDDAAKVVHASLKCGVFDPISVDSLTEAWIEVPFERFRRCQPRIVEQVIDCTLDRGHFG